MKFGRLGSLISWSQPRPTFPDEEPEGGGEVNLALFGVDEEGAEVDLGLFAVDEGGPEVSLGLFAVDEAREAWGALQRPLTGDRLTPG